ncbi:MAG: 3-deoxy-D-manno-octulosonic acid transferase, partial [Longimicrobiales bacterium]
MKRRYDLLYALGTLVSGPVLAVGLLRTGKWRTDWRGRFGRAHPLPDDTRPTLLIHGVSVGEINATRELVAHLTGPGAPPVRVVVSATTNTGFARAQALYGDRLPVVRFPFDFSWMVNRFFDAIRPDAVALMELEVWPNLAQICRIRGVPLAVINGRLSDASFKNYRRARPFMGFVFRALSQVGAQTEEYARRFRALGTPPERITVTDTMKWDTVRLVDEVEGAELLRAALGIDPQRPLVVAGSTGPGEEGRLISEKPDGVQLLLVPRKPERFEEVARLAEGIVRRSERPDGVTGSPSPTDLYLLDTMGELTKAYALAQVAVVGRSFVPMGGSDPIEAVALGKPTVMGPHHENFRDVVSAFAASGGIRITDDPMEAVKSLLADPAARKELGEAGRKVIRERQGATERNAALLRDLLGRKEEGGFPPTPIRGRVRRWLLPTFLLYMAAGYLTTAVDRVPAQDGAPPSAPLPALDGSLLSGVFSVHTDRSRDATGSREEVARAAVAAGLDFVVIGDHPPDDRKPGWTFWDPVFLEGVFVEGGQELRSPGAGKILAVAVDTTYRQWRGDYASFVDMLAREGATAFVVHGRGPRGSERWVAPSVEGIHGWEVLDISEFARHRLSGFWSLYHALTLAAGTPLGLGDQALLHLMREGFDTPTVAAYDSFRVGASLTATAGLNVHPKVRIGSLLVPSYELFFRTLVTHVAVEARHPSAPSADAAEARERLMAGVKGGAAFVSLGGREEARGFRMGVMTGDRLQAGMGSTAVLAEGSLLRAGFVRVGPGRDGALAGEAHPDDAGESDSGPARSAETRSLLDGALAGEAHPDDAGESGSGPPRSAETRSVRDGAAEAGTTGEPTRKLLYRILRDGREVAWVSGGEMEWRPTGPGVYRVEVYRYAARL